MEIRIPYGHAALSAVIPDNFPVDLIRAPFIPGEEDPIQAVRNALNRLVGEIDFEGFSGAHSAAIAVNDKTRPVPNHQLLPPLLERVNQLGIPDERITIYIATGSHPPPSPADFSAILDPDSMARCNVIPHDAQDEGQLVYLGDTSRDTPVWSNSGFINADLKITVGIIGPHQFAGFSGGVKTAAIGLSGLETINRNHTLMMDPDARLGEIEKNPVRQDIEEIGQLMGVDLVLNAILNEQKELVRVLAGTPRAVMEEGVPIARQMCRVPVPQTYELVIASPGGYPKDINVYQSQKAFSSAVRITRPDGMVIIAAACPEGSGSSHYEDWVRGKNAYLDVRRCFATEGFRLGPHKAYLWARDAEKARLMFCSTMREELAKSLLLNPMKDFQTAVDTALADLRPGERIAVLPHAAAIIPDLL